MKSWFEKFNLQASSTTPFYNLYLGGNGDKYVHGRQILPLTIRLASRDTNEADSGSSQISYDQCSNGLLVLSDFMENVGHAMYAASELYALFKEGALTGYPSIIIANPWQSLTRFHRAVFSAVSNYDILDWNPKQEFPLRATDEIAKGTVQSNDGNSKNDVNTNEVRCFERLDICRVYGTSYMRGVENMFELGSLVCSVNFRIAPLVAVNASIGSALYCYILLIYEIIIY